MGGGKPKEMVEAWYLCVAHVFIDAASETMSNMYINIEYTIH